MEKTQIINTKYGNIQGYIEKSIKVFKGIPYAAPPVGEYRFKPPKPPKRIDGVFEAIEFSQICPQVPVLPSAQWIFGTQLEESEAESLTLNIWTPETDDKYRPVMFWIHGGNFNNGSSAQLTYDGLPLSLRGDVVVVSINYRLGPLGYLYIPGITANVGQLDQIAALEWIRDNIKAFGGDPHNVTIFGESAGAAAVITLLAMPAVKNLFHRAIAQSTPSYYSVLHKEGSNDICSTLKIKPGDIEELQKVSVENIKNAHRNYITKTFLQGRSNPFSPVVDGKTLPEEPLKAIRS
ncbi:MAG: carboxylesterase family protein, partial [Candidatus Hermodarchaeota archaeon]